MSQGDTTITSQTIDGGAALGTTFYNVIVDQDAAVTVNQTNATTTIQNNLTVGPAAEALSTTVNTVNFNSGGTVVTVAATAGFAATGTIQILGTSITYTGTTITTMPNA